MSHVPKTPQYHHTPQAREDTYAVMPRRVGKDGSGGYGMGVAPHPGYDQTPTVVGLAKPFQPQPLGQMSTMTLRALKKTHPVDFDQLREPFHWTTTRKGCEKFFTEAVDRKAGMEVVQGKNPMIAASESSGFASGGGATGRSHSGYGEREPAEAYNAKTLKDMKSKNPVEFWDIIRKADHPTACDTQTTSANFQMMGTHPNDPRYYWTSKTAVGLM